MKVRNNHIWSCLHISINTLLTTTNTLELRISAARRRYVFICDKTVLPFEMFLFFSFLLCCFFCAHFLTQHQIYVFTLAGIVASSPSSLYC